MPIRIQIASLLAVGSALVSAACATARGPADLARPDVPAAIALPAGEQIAVRLEARGTQNYECRTKREAPGENEWALVAPEADLFDAAGKKVGRHYAGPTWESDLDGSKVVAAVKARADGPQADAIPWLLLSATQASDGGLLGKVRSVQRIDTRGGRAPAGGCSVGETLKVPYTAVYSFSRAQRARDGESEPYRPQVPSY